MHRVVAKKRLPHCSRCGSDLLISAVMPQNDAEGRPIHLELCWACDSGKPDRPAAGIPPSVVRGRRRARHHPR
ncbi:DUF6300 family protein [Streptomyces sp. NPDC059071]|uniref:DUF6300 family protein n=1 Tax=unclassified Streptomyces TaxID=2593676 RepID=UPI003650543F